MDLHVLSGLLAAPPRRTKRGCDITGVDVAPKVRAAFGKMVTALLQDVIAVRHDHVVSSWVWRGTALRCRLPTQASLRCDQARVGASLSFAAQNAHATNTRRPQQTKIVTDRRKREQRRRASFKPGGGGILIRAGHLFIQLQSDTGPIAYPNISVLDNIRFVTGQGGPIIAVEPVKLEHQKVWDAGTHMARCHGSNG